MCGDVMVYRCVCWWVCFLGYFDSIDPWFRSSIMYRLVCIYIPYWSKTVYFIYYISILIQFGCSVWIHFCAYHRWLFSHLISLDRSVLTMVCDRLFSLLHERLVEYVPLTSSSSDPIRGMMVDSESHPFGIHEMCYIAGRSCCCWCVFVCGAVPERHGLLLSFWLVYLACWLWCMCCLWHWVGRSYWTYACMDILWYLGVASCFRGGTANCYFSLSVIAVLICSRLIVGLLLCMVECVLCDVFVLVIMAGHCYLTEWYYSVSLWW